MDPSAEDPPPPVPPAPPDAVVDPYRDPLAKAVEAERAEVRRLVDAGASSPEDLRLLAEKMKQQRLAEERAWREKVKPELMASKKFNLSALRSDAPEGRDEQRRFLAGAGLIVLVVAVVLMVSSAPWAVIVVLLAGLLVYAWVLGRRPPSAEPPAAADAGDPGDDPADGPPGP